MLESEDLAAWRRRIFVVSWITYAGYYLCRVNLAVTLPALQVQFEWGKAGSGLLGAALLWSYAGGQLLMGHLGDRLSARRLIAVGLVLSAILNLLFGSLHSLVPMVMACAFNGLAQATGWGPIMHTLSRWFGPRRRGKLTALFTPSYLVGHAVSWALAGWLAARWGWRYAFWVPAIMVLAVASFWCLLSRDGPDMVVSGMHTDGDGESSQRTWSLWAGIAAILRHPKLRWALITCLLSGMIKEGLSLWVPTYLNEVQGIQLASAAIFGVVVPISGAVGAMLSGWLVHRATKGREAPVAAGAGLLLILTCLGLYWFGFDGGPLLAVIFLSGMGLGSHGLNALLMASLPLSLGPEGRVSSTAGTLDFASYVGGGVSGVVAGVLLDASGWSGVYGLWVLVAGLIVVLAIGQVVRLRRGNPAA